MVKKKPQGRKRVLADHRKIGSRLVPPFPQAFPTEDVRWSGHIIPELLWLALLNDHHGWKQGAALSLDLARASTEATGVSPKEFQKKFGKAPKQWFASTSSYSTLTDQQKVKIVTLLEARASLSSIQAGLSPLVALYPKCPLDFLFEGSIPTRADVDLESFKRVVSSHFNKEGIATVRTLTNAVYIAFCTNKLRVIVSNDGKSPTDPKLRNLPAIEQYPTTEESRIVASSVHGTVFGLFEKNQSEWADYFWNRGLEIEPCDYEGVIKDEV